MRLSIAGVKASQDQMSALIQLPNFDIAEMQNTGKEHPRWIHFGPGNIFRGYIARISADTIEAGELWPIVAVATNQGETLDVQLSAHDLMSLVVTVHPNGKRDLRVVAGISEGLAAGRPKDFQRLIALIENPNVTTFRTGLT